MAKYELHEEKPDHFVVMGGDGKAFSVAKHGLSPEMLSKIKSLKPKKMADGGEVEEAPETDAEEGASAEAEPLQAEPVSDAEAAAPADQAVGQAAPSALDQLANAPDATNPAPATNPAASPDVELPGALGQYAKAQGQAIDTGAQVQKQQAEEQAKIYDDYIRQVQAEHLEYQKQRTQNMAEHQQLHDKIMNAQIDPYRLWHDASTGNKILAGIGILLGGAGTLNGGRNPALDAINNAMDKDVEAQKANLGKQQSLLSENLRQYGDINTAEAATRQQLNTIAQAQIARAAARSGSPIAMQQAALAKANLGVQNTMLANTVALNKTKAKVLGAGGSGGGIPTSQVPYQLLNDPEFQKKRVDVGGITFQGNTPEDAQAIKTMQALHAPITEDIGRLKSMGDYALKPEARHEVNAMINRLADNINKFNNSVKGTGRFTEFTRDQIAEQLKNPNNVYQMVMGNGANVDVLNALNTKLESERAQRLNGYGKGGPAGNRGSLVYDSRVTKR